MRRANPGKGSVKQGAHIDGYSRRMVCRFDHETADALYDRAKAEGTSTSEIIRRYVEWGREVDE